ncbi:hypothetical protein D3C76_1402710 [compost metagenome]
MLDHLASRLQAGIELAQHISDGTGALFAAAHFVIQAGDAQVLGHSVDLGDEPQRITAAGHVAQAGPAGEGDQHRQQQHKTEADAQLAVYANVSQFIGQPLVHAVTPLDHILVSWALYRLQAGNL